jgi:hypothetical protein
MTSILVLRSRRRSVALLVAAVAAGTAPVHAAEKEVWGFYRSSDTESRLFYGIPESDALTIVFICNRGQHRLVIVSNNAPEPRRGAGPASIVLTNGTRTNRYGGKFVYDRDYEAYHFEAETAADRRALDILRSGSRLLVRVAGHRDGVPLKGAGRPLGRFLAACFGGSDR